jgi:DNA-directed RNA polymerase subunit RPC12/RpoP
LKCSRCGKPLSPGKRCDSCGHSGKPDPNRGIAAKRTSRPGDALDVIAVRCTHCRKKFGIKPRTAEKMVACPHCQTKQLVRTASAETETSSTPDPAAEVPGQHESAPSPSTGTASLPAAQREMSTVPTVDELLPPRYLVPPDLERETMALTTQLPSPIIKNPPGFEIDTRMLRVPVGHREAIIRPLSRDVRDQRKRIRVGIVYLLGIVVLIVVFWWLLGRIDLEP